MVDAYAKIFIFALCITTYQVYYGKISHGSNIAVMNEWRRNDDGLITKTLILNVHAPWVDNLISKRSVDDWDMSLSYLPLPMSGI